LSNLRIMALSNQQVTLIHQATLQVLATTGVEVGLPRAVEMLRNAGAHVAENKRVRIPGGLVEKALDAVPKTQTIYNRKGQPALFLEGDNTHYGTGPTTPMVRDPFSGERRESCHGDIECAARLCDALPNIDYVMSMGLSGGRDPRKHGFHPEITDRLDFLAMLRNTLKPIIFSAWSLKGLEDIHGIAAAVVGGEQALAAKPLAIHYSEPTSPLVHGAAALEKLLFCAEKRMPLLYMGGPLAGGTAPVTVAGQLVVSNAECLSGLVLHQLCSPGAPFIYGSGSNPMDMRTTLAAYCGPDAFLSNVAGKSLADYYGLPDFNYGGLSDANIMDGQMTWEAGFSLLQAELCGSNLVHDVGYLETGMTACLELIVFCDEVIGELRHFKKGLTVNAESLAVEVIDQVGPGGSYLDNDHTFRNFRSIWYPQLRNRDSFEKWQDKGSMPLEKRLNARVQHILKTHRPEALSQAAESQIADIMHRADKYYAQA
jgi:trimethylamine--corrinoid protein Co-methyltransferase